jgi:peptide/nickel transport system permease protein
MTTTTRPIGFKERLLGAWAVRRMEPGTAVWYFRRDRIALLSFIFLTLVILAAIFAPLLTPYPEQGMGVPNITEKFQAPSITHPMGTDGLGRDLLARILYGARTSLLMGFSIVILGGSIGVFLGALAGYFGGWIDEVIMRITDIFLAFPPLLLAIVFAAVMEPSIQTTIIAITLVWWPVYARIVRGQVLSVRERDYVKAARGIGVGDFTIIRRHVLPNVMGPVMVQGTLDLGAAILTAAALSFLGLGTEPPTADWGVMVDEGRQHLLSGRWWLAVFPGLVLFLTAMALNLIGDGVRDASDPYTRG